MFCSYLGPEADPTFRSRPRLAGSFPREHAPLKRAPSSEDLSLRWESWVPPFPPAPFLRSIQGKAVSTSLVPAVLSFVPFVGGGGWVMSLPRP